MNIKEVAVKFGVTIQHVKFEPVNVQVEIKADINEAEIEAGGLNDLLVQAKQEVAYGLFEFAETRLRAAKWRETDTTEEYMEQARRISPEFRWMHDLHPDMAADLLANVLVDYFEPVEIPQTVIAEAVEDDAAADCDPIQHLRDMADDKTVTKAQFNEALQDYFAPDYAPLADDEAARMEADAAAAQDDDYERALAAKAAANGTGKDAGDIPF